MSPTAEDPIHVLHVDDDPDLADVVATLLQETDDRLAVETATSAGDALDRLDGSVDCVVSDYDMPGRDGIELLEAVRDEHPDLPFVLFTGKGSEEVASDAISAGVTDYLQKETGTDQYAILANRVGNAVERYAAEQAVETTEHRFRKLLENAADYVHVLDADGTVEYVTPSVERVLGYEPGTLEGTDAFETVHPEDAAAARETFEAILDEPGGEATLEVRARHTDGSWRWLEVRSRNLLDDAAIGGVVGNVRDVTERKNREARVDWHRTILRNIREDVYVFDADHRFQFVNDRVRDLDAFPEGQWTDRPVSYLAETGVLSPQEVAWVEEGIDRVLAGDADEVNIEIEPSVPGETETADLRLTPLDLRDRENLVLGTTRDVTGRTERERRLERYREYTDRLLDASDDLFFVADEAGNLQRWNDTVTDVTGYSDAEVGSMNVLDFVPEDHRASGVEAMAEVFETGHGQLEAPVLTSDGSTDLYEFRADRVEHPDGDPRLVGIGRNVTVRKGREQRLEALHNATRDLIQAGSREAVADTAVETTRDILDLPINGFYFYDERTNALEPVTVTDASADLLGEPPVFEPGKSLAWEAFQSGEMDVFETVSTEPGRHNDETPIRSEILLPVGEYGIMVIGSTEPSAFDETDLSLARILASNTEAALARTEREQELARQNERLGEFASIVSHDLRNPLQVAGGRLEVAREERDSEHLEAVARAHDRMEALIDDLLRLAREGDAVETVEPVDLEAFADACWETVRTAEATLVAETSATVLADRGRLQQLLENLLRNAVEHGSTSSRPGADDAVEHAGDGVTITVGDLDDGRGFYVADDGPGIPEADREAVFESGYSTSADGTGFGLSIVSEIASAHGWEIEVTDSVDGGARFEVRGVEFE